MCYHFIGYVVLFRATDLIHRSLMEGLLNKTELATIKIPNSDMKHHAGIFMRLNDEEIIYKGNYYDVKNEISDNQFTFFQVIKDLEENIWHTKLNDAQSNANANHSTGKTLKSISKAFSPKWFSHFQFQFIQPNPSRCFLVFRTENIFSVSEDVFLPPPKG